MKNVLRIIMGIIAAFLLMLLSLSLNSCSVQHHCTTVYVTFSDCDGSSDTISAPTIFIDKGSVLIESETRRRYQIYKVTPQEVQVSERGGVFHYIKDK